MYFTREQIVANFEGHGYRFHNFQLSTEGDYDPADAEFNYADIPHVRFVHNEFQTVPCLVEQNKLGTLHLQKALGLTFPVSVICYHHSRTHQTAYFTFMFAMVLVTTEFVTVTPGRTRVISHYSIGTTKWLRFFAPIMQWLITRNYHGLMKDDIPMRERRGLLRKWGYKFQTDDHRYGYKESMDITKINLVPAASIVPEPVKIKLDQDLAPGASMMIGRSDHFGLKVTRTAQDDVLFHPRLCNHEGASLDEAKCLGNKLQCPWHGKAFAPVAAFSLKSGNRTIQGENHDIEFVDGVFTVKFKEKAGLQTAQTSSPCATRPVLA